ncbi:MAG: hypothetical protein R3B89_28450 [Polyangiaceae bacterium]
MPGEVFDLAYKMGSLYWIAEVPGNGSTTNTTYTVSAMALSDQVVHDLATGLTRSVALVVDDTHVYIANQAGAAIYRVPIAGGALELVSVSPTPTSLAEAGDNIYFRSQFGTTVFSAPKAGGSAIEVFDTGLSNSSWSPVLADAWGVYAGQTVHPFADGCPEFKLNRCLSTRIAAIDRSEFYQTWDQACGSKSAVNRETFFEREAASHVIYDGSDNQTPGYRIKTEGGRLYEVFADWNLDDYTHLYTRYRCGNQSAARILDSQITPRHGAMAFDNDYFYYVHIRWSPGPGYEYHIYRAPR